MRASVVFMFIAVIGLAAAACPNSCSGHGTCSQWDKCSCFKRKDGTTTLEGDIVPAFVGADCSLRTCPFQLAWSDIPYANNRAHLSAECSNAGTCDRKSGNCVCFPGFEGRACDRTVCPNDCSGHGTCQSLMTFYRDMNDVFTTPATYVSYGWQNNFNDFQTWDAKKTYGCKCENGFRGPDCSLVECPTGKDPQGGPSGTAFLRTALDGTSSTKETRDCSGRGICDYTSGICQCFKGQYGDDCSLQSALV